MLRRCTDEDISDEECEKVIDPFYENYDSYLEEYVIPEVIKLLKLKYSLEIINEDSLDFKIIEY